MELLGRVKSSSAGQLRKLGKCYATSSWDFFSWKVLKSKLTVNMLLWLFLASMLASLGNDSNVFSGHSLFIFLFYCLIGQYSDYNR